MATEIFVTAPVAISLETISSLLCSAFEGGSNYWYEIVDEIAPKADDLWLGESYKGDEFSHLQYPLSHGGKLVVRDTTDLGDEGPLYTLDLAAVKHGLQAMAKDAPRHFADILNDRADAVTGDVFLQFCLFGENIYG